MSDQNQRGPVAAERPAEAAAVRRVRNPFGASRQKLTLDPRPGYVRYWFNDEPGRIELAISGGWTHIKGPDGQNRKMVVNPASNGMVAYAMEIREEWYREDMTSDDSGAQKSERTMQAIRRGKDIANASESDKQHFYAGAQGRNIKIADQRRAAPATTDESR